MRLPALWLALGGSLAAGLLFVLIRVVTPSDGARVASYDNAWSGPLGRTEASHV
jgi:hypothetical protein